MADWVYAETGSIKLEFEVADISDVYFTQGLFTSLPRLKPPHF